MFPILWNFPFRKKNGDMSTIGAEIGGAGSELPPHSSSDAGKLLGIKPNGSLEWSDTVNSEIQTLTQKTENINDVISENGAKNLLPIDLATLKAQNTASGSSWNGNTYTWRDVSYTLNDDGTISVVTSGTTSLDSQLNIVVNNSDDIAHLVGKNVALSGCPSGGASNTYNIRYNDSNGNQYETGNGISINSLPANAKLYISVEAGANYPTPKVFKPMITLASQPNSDYAHYAPYAMTNRELTDIKSIPITLNSDYFDNNATAQCFKLGRLVWLQISGTTIAQIPSGNIYLTTSNNIPNPKVDVGIIGFAWNTTSGILGQLRISSNAINFPFNTAIPSGTQFKITLMYMTEE